MIDIYMIDIYIKKETVPPYFLYIFIMDYGGNVICVYGVNLSSRIIRKHLQSL